MIRSKDNRCYTWSNQNPYHGHRCMMCDMRDGYDHPNPTLMMTPKGCMGRYFSQGKFRFRLYFSAKCMVQPKKDMKQRKQKKIEMKKRINKMFEGVSVKKLMQTIGM